MKIAQEDINLIKKDKGHTYQYGDKTFPSVTTIINYVVNKPALTQWAFNTGIKSTAIYLNDEYKVLGENFIVPTDGEIKLALDEREMTHTHEMERGGERGDQLHKVLAAIIRGEDYTYSKEHKPYVDQLFNFIEDYDPEWHASEVKLVSLEYGFAGTLDAICTIRKHPSRRRHKSLVGATVLVDPKSNKEGRVYPETHLPQVEAYEKAYLEMGGDPVDAKLVLGLGPKRFQPCVSYARFYTFNLIHQLYDEFHWMKSNNPNARK